jgi:iron complex outermembrane recepter protein
MNSSPCIFHVRKSLAIAVATALLAPAASVIAQDSSSFQLEEVRVTATRRGETDILSTPVAVTAISGDIAEAFSPRDLNEIAFEVPSLSMGTVSAFRSASFAMRGVAETTIILYKEPPVGVTIDDFVVPHLQSQNLEMFDIEQVEVLRGPQGTLFGKNTTAGVINVHTKRPLTDERSLDLRAEVGDFGTKKFQAALNVPLIEDKLAFRFAGMKLDSDGFYENGASYGPLASFLPPSAAGTMVEGDGDDAGGDDVFSSRSKLLWTPTENFSALFQFEYIRDDGDTPPLVNESTEGYVFSAWGYTANKGDPLKNAGVTYRDDNLMKMSDGHRVDIDGYYLNLDWEIGDFSLHSVTGYREQESRLPNTYTGVPGPISLFDATRNDDRETFQQEVRLVSNWDGPFNFVAGGFYQTNDDTFCVLQIVGFLDFFGLGTPDGFFNENPLILCNQQDATAYAGFLDGTYDISDRLHLSAGVRFNNEEKEWTGRPRRNIDAIDDGLFNGSLSIDDINDPIELANWSKYPSGVVEDDHSWSDPTYRVTLAYDISEEWFGYAGYARGFRSGGYNDQLGTTLDPITALAAEPVDPEYADSYEIGLKGDLFDGRANIALTGYWVTYEDAQRTFNVSFPNGGQETLFFNAAEMEVMGLEFEGSWRASENLTLRANAAWMDAQFNEFSADTDYDGVVDIDLSDKEPTRAPEWMATADANYVYPLGSAGDLAFNVRVAYEDESLYAYSDVSPEYDTTLDSKTLWDASVTFTAPEEKYFVRAIGKNLTDQRYRTGVLSVATIWIMSAYGAPRYFGLEFGTKFDF